MRRATFLLLMMCFASMTVFGQSIEELTKERDGKAAARDALKATIDELTGQFKSLDAEVTALTDQITPYPRWSVGAFGTVGLSFANYNDWLSKDLPNTSAATIGLSVNAFAHLDQEKYFWRNTGNLNLGWLKFDNKDSEEDINDFQVSSDAFDLTSLFGYKLSPKLAISVLAEYRTSLLDGRFNDPSFLDIGTGITWTPIPDLVVVIHPGNYNFVFHKSDFDYQSSAGAKIVADYAKKLTSGISWKSNLSAFLSYKDSDLSNWTWVNSFSTAVKGIGVGFELGLRQNKQEALARELTDNPLQTYWILGLSYAIGGK
jgi:hypothetical protein